MINDPWLKTSIMAKRGLAKGQAGKRHELSIAAQGDFHYVYGPYAKPVLTINPGDLVAVETEDAFGGVITSEQDSPTAKLKFPSIRSAAPLPSAAWRRAIAWPSTFMRWKQGARSLRAPPASSRNSAAWSEPRLPPCSIRPCRSG
jgi:hypothetical protein